MKLTAVSLKFRCPFSGRDMEFCIPETERLYQLLSLKELRCELMERGCIG